MTGVFPRVGRDSLKIAVLKQKKPHPLSLFFGGCGSKVRVSLFAGLKSFDLFRQTGNGSCDFVHRENALADGSHQFGFRGFESGGGGFFGAGGNGGFHLLDESADSALAGAVDNAAFAVAVNSGFCRFMIGHFILSCTKLS